MEKCIMEYEQMVMHEIENIISKGELNPNDVKNIGEAVDILKDLYTIDAMKNADYGMEQNYGSNRAQEYMEPDYPMMNEPTSRMYDDGYARRTAYRNGRSRRGYPRDNMREMW